MTENRTGESAPGQVRATGHRRPAATAAGLVILGLLATAGCGDEDSSRKHRHLEGTIEKIDQLNSEITLRYFSEKHKTEANVTGMVNAETEIFINGRLSSLDDLREGERVIVVGWVKGRGAERDVVAVKITVERADTIRREPPTQPSGADPGAGQPGSDAAADTPRQIPTDDDDAGE
ncbi:MAG TPA: hypothetical protein VM243_03305 [Phycisphaerae bacterium]|nr:hypothetical protein [Phycisphaerae bacterium]